MFQLRSLYSFHWDRKIIVNGEYVRISKDTVVDCFKAQSQQQRL